MATDLETPPSAPPRPRRRRRAISPVLVVVAALGIAWFAQRSLVAEGLLVDAAFAFLVAGVLYVYATRTRAIETTTPVPRRLELAGVGLVLLVAVVFRFNQLGSQPEGVWFDEAQNGLVALRILNEPGFRPIFVPDLTQLPAFFFYLLARAINLFGANILAIRLVSTLLGLAAVVGLYFLARHLFGVPVALVAAFLLAAQRWHVSFSRFGMNGILVPALEVGAMYFAIRGLRAGRWSDLAVAGIFLGLGFNSYLAFYVVPVILAITTMAMLAREPLAFVRRNWVGLAAVLVAALLVAAPLIRHSIQFPEESLARAQTTSIFTGKSTEQARAALLENVRRHVLMFNYQGDPNGRHNLPGAPMLDAASAALFVLGLVYAARHAANYRYAFLLAWLILALLPGVLSLEFEAPQAYRSIGATPAVALVAALGLGWLATRAWEDRRRVIGAIAGLPVVAALGFAAVTNFDTFFNKQLYDPSAWVSYSTPETLVAREANELPPDATILLAETYANHPTLRFVAPRLSGAPVFDPIMHLPVRGEQGVTIFADPAVDRSAALLRRYYPGARVVEHRGPRDAGSNVMTTVVIDRDQVLSLQGAGASYFPGADADVRGTPAAQRKEDGIGLVAQPPPLPPPFTGHWKSIVSVAQYGRYRFRLEGAPESVFYLDETEMVRGGQEPVEVTLARGNHSLRLVAPVTAAPAPRLLWQTPELPQWRPIARDSQFVEPVTNNGLLGSYFANNAWRGPPAFQRIDPALSFRFHLLPLPRPYTIEWRGKIAIPADGSYRFATQSIDHSWLYVDERLIVDNSRQHDALVEGAVTLTAGFHDIRVRFIDQTNFTHIEVYWTPPGRGRELIPTERLLPPQGAYPEKVAPLAGPAVPPPSSTQTSPAARPTAVPAAPAAPTPAPVGRGRSIPDPPTVVVIGAAGAGPGQLTDPRGVNLDSNGNIWVADFANRRVQKFNAAGQFVLAIGPSDGDLAFEQPLAVSFDPAGNAIVLDSTAPWIRRFDSEGRFIARFAGPQVGTYQPRGMDVDRQGNVYVADTGKARVILFDPSGQMVGQIGGEGQPEKLVAEPVDVAIDPADNLFIADSSLSRVVKLGPDRAVVAQWTVPSSSSVHGPHFAVDGAGGVYLSDPESGRILRYGPRGELIEEYGPLEADGVRANRPLGMRLVGDQLYVADSANNRILRVTVSR